MNLQEAIKILGDFRLRPDIDGYCAISRTGIDPQYIQQALQTLLDLAEKIDKISNSGLVVEEKGDTCSPIVRAAHNRCREQSILLLAKKILSQLKPKIDEERLRKIIYKELLATAIIINEISTRVGKPEFKPNYEDSRALNLAYKKISNVEYIAHAIATQFIKPEIDLKRLEKNLLADLRFEDYRQKKFTVGWLLKSIMEVISKELTYD